MTLQIPDLCLVVLIGASGSGKSTFARRHFLPTETISSDACRGLVCDDENSLAANQDAFELLHFLAAKRLTRGRLTVIDATNVQPDARQPLVALARAQHLFAVAIVLDLPEAVCRERNDTRPDRSFGPHVIAQHRRSLRRTLPNLRREGFRTVHVLSSVEEVEQATIVRAPLWSDRRGEHGPFDIIGDVHGCREELASLLTELGYGVIAEESARYGVRVRPPDGRRLVFVGDLVDRGPDSPGVLRLAMSACADGVALAVPGNHDIKLARALAGNRVALKHGIVETLEQLEREPPEFRAEVGTFLGELVSHYVLDDGKLVVAHAGIVEAMQGRSSGAVREFCLYGDTTGETDEFGLPVRLDWAANYRGKATVVYGHVAVEQPEWVNRTIDIDTGCVFGGRLTALRWPERELVSVPALKTWFEPVRPLAARTPERPANVLDLSDVQGKRSISTRLQGRITIRAEQSAGALEVMGRFAVDPRWLIYLPPTMSPAETSREPGLLEHPAEALAYYRERGVAEAVCQQKHMGSRAVLVVCRDQRTAAARFGIDDEAAGACYTRTGRPFFRDRAQEVELLAIVRAAVDASGLWQELATDWLCLDAELMPWSAKAQALLRQTYAPVGAAAAAGLSASVEALAQAAGHGAPVAELLERTRERLADAHAFRAAWRNYCWTAETVSDMLLAPFHLLAGESGTFLDRDHVWQMETIARLVQYSSGVLYATPWRLVALDDEASCAAAVAWWEELTAGGGEGMVVKPRDFIALHEGRPLQPAVKCRGREYLRIIYGPEYARPEHLERLRQRGLGAKRGLAIREFSLGVEALERFVRREPLYAVHECVFGVLAMETEPVDARL